MKMDGLIFQGARYYKSLNLTTKYDFYISISGNWHTYSTYTAIYFILAVIGYIIPKQDNFFSSKDKIYISYPNASITKETNR